MAQGRVARPYLHEVDLVRSVTALCVVAVHVLALTVAPNTSTLAIQLQDGVVEALHFSREVFLAVTAFVLVYGYANSRLDVFTFWRKRGIGVLVPYVAWSLVYVWLGVPHQPISAWLSTALVSVLTGSASYQLYFITLTLEFYLILPAFLALLKRVGTRHPWRLLIASGALQLVLLFAAHRYVEAGTFPTTPLGQLLATGENRLLPLYQFYLVLGGLAALHMERLRAFVLRHGSWIVFGMGLGLGALWLRYGFAIFVQGQNDAYAISVFQPVMLFYSAASALFLYWLGVSWASGRVSAPPRGSRFFSLLAKASFGVYLVHAVILDWVLKIVLPVLPSALPVALRAGLIFGLVATLSVVVVTAMLYTPGLSRLVGRPCKLSWRPRVALVAANEMLEGWRSAISRRIHEPQSALS